MNSHSNNNYWKSRLMVEECSREGARVNAKSKNFTNKKRRDNISTLLVLLLYVCLSATEYNLILITETVT